ncbi:secretion system protein [Alicyclobacillus cellulosilyticus]|uniref:Secretion system protein n=1 Tax=Alicyclobacillus cellulosilyticus TaxID=1003997 RepID=A0A917KFS8_9BACL|nr:type II secretion system F family protein [Alicyclobacillus cellulosilyticus]GGJ09513.1 secretion system protein [Alicyclobacillus cellulosilyticus]
MPEFRYTVLDGNGRRRRGRMVASDIEEVLSFFRRSGWYVLEVQPSEQAAWWRKEITLGQRVKLRDFAVFCRQFATLVRAGVTLLDGVQILVAQTQSKPLRRALEQVAARIREGWSLSQATAEHPSVFPPVFISMVRAGEAGGTLDIALERLALHFERSHQTREKVKSALTYPAIVGIVAAAVTVFLLVRIVPTFVAMFAAYRVELPLPTRLVMGLSRLLRAGWWGVILAIALLFALHRWARRKPGYRRVFDQARFRLPLFGRMRQTAVMAQMARTLGSLIASAVPLAQTLRLTAEVVDDAVVSETLRAATASLEAGGTLSEALRQNRLIPPLVAEMVAIGEQTGELDFVLERLAGFYEQEAEAYADRLKQVLEPVMIVVLAVIVGTIVLSVILPSFRLLQALH